MHITRISSFMARCTRKAIAMTVRRARASWRRSKPRSVIEREAVEQHKTLDAHYAHLIIHGALHAQGYRHDCPESARIMETLETERLFALGFADPYIAKRI